METRTIFYKFAGELVHLRLKAKNKATIERFEKDVLNTGFVHTVRYGSSNYAKPKKNLFTKIFKSCKNLLRSKS